MEVVDTGFVKEEVDHGGCAVEEMPYENRVQRGQDYVSGTKYNATESRKDDLLRTCFQEPYDDVHYRLLAHNTIMLVCRAWLTKAPWNIPKDQQNNLIYCDDKGMLSLSAVAEHANGKQLEWAIKDGFLAEILSWKMDVEEPKAAIIISNAMQAGNTIAMRTSELTAISVLKGEIIVQSANISQKVTFKSVLAETRKELSLAADDPDLIEVFLYLVSLGVGSNSYVNELQEFARFFVNSKYRQLRFAAFGCANAAPENCPLVKLALIKRAYRKKPYNAFCPSPEQDWGKFKHVMELEAILRFFHAYCKEEVSKLASC